LSRDDFLGEFGVLVGICGSAHLNDASSCAALRLPAVDDAASLRNELADRVDHSLLIARRERVVERQPHEALSSLFGNWALPNTPTEVLANWGGHATSWRIRLALQGKEFPSLMRRSVSGLWIFSANRRRFLGGVA